MSPMPGSSDARSSISATGSRARARCATRTASCRRNGSPRRAGSGSTTAQAKGRRVERQAPLEARTEPSRLGKAFGRKAPGLCARAPPISQLGEDERAAGGIGIGEAVLLAEHFGVGEPPVLVALEPDPLAARHLRKLGEREEQELAVIADHRHPVAANR